jgi:electron transfer flavoprotein-quinone oxidoreductase
MVGQLAMNGMLVAGEAAGLTINSGLVVRGMDLAIGSGIAAADAAAEAIAKGDISKSGLAGYRRRLEDSFVLQDMRTYARAPQFFERPELYGAYGELAASILQSTYSLDGTPRKHLARVARQALKTSSVKSRRLLRDAVAGVRSL